MFIKNFLKPGDYLMPVPVGLPITLQYSDRGIVEKVYIGWKDSKKKSSEDFYKSFIQSNVCPMNISVKGGTTWISGVLHSKDIFYDNGPLPDCIFSSLESAFIKDSDKFKFYAGNIDSLATIFRGANPIVNWLNMSGFDVLPGWITPANITKSSFYKMLNTPRFTSNFTFGLVSNYIVYRGSSVLYVDTHIKQFVVSKVSKFIDDYGYIRCNVYSRDPSMNYITLNYSDVVSFNIQTNSLVVLDENDSVIYSCCTDNKKREPRSKNSYCDVCGKPLIVPNSGLTECTDPHCKSKWLSKINQMLTVFKLPTMNRSRFDSVLNSLICLSDVFSLEEYKECFVNTSLSNLLEAVVPRSIVTDSKLFDQFTRKCSNVIKTFVYYVHNPNGILDELELSGLQAINLVKWLSDSYNQSEIDDLLDCSQIHINMTEQVFDGPPIFRNKTIMLTGCFKHGDYKQIASILRSYSASVVYEFSENVNCILVGDILEDINGSAIRNAYKYNVPVMSEDNFFKQYEIDQDLAENLV